MLATIIICAALAVATAAVIIKAVRDKKNGKTSCSCGCSGCASEGMCHPKAEN